MEVSRKPKKIDFNHPFSPVSNGGAFHRYLLYNNACDSSILWAYGKPIQEAWRTMPAPWRVCLMNLLDGRHLLDGEYRDEVERELGGPFHWIEGYNTPATNQLALFYLNRRYPFSKFEDAARKKGLI